MKPGRPSANDRKIIPLPGTNRIDAPASLTVKERALFREIVASCPHSQFGPADVYLLASFTRVTLISESASRHLHRARSTKERSAKMKELDSAMKLQAQLATKLRLATTARTDPRKLARQHAAHLPSVYDMMGDDDDDR